MPGLSSQSEGQISDVCTGRRVQSLAFFFVGLEAIHPETISECLPFLVESPSGTDVDNRNWSITEYSGIRYEMTRHQRLRIQADRHVKGGAA
jgi:hypothetical protein